MNCIRTTIIILIFSILLFSTSFGQGTVSLDHVDGLSGTGKINFGTPLTFHFRLTNSSDFPIAASTNGFQMYSPDGAQWSPLTADTAHLGWGNIFDGGIFFTQANVTGSGIDTIGIGGFKIDQGGLPVGFDDIAFSISTEVSSAYLGQTLCIDSCYYPPAGFWFWSHADDGYTEPAWDGPYCWEISGCCVHRADINGDGSGPDISDLVFLVTYMFSGGDAPPCLEPNGGTTDINGSGSGPDITDLIYLVTFMFTGGPAPVDCP